MTSTTTPYTEEHFALMEHDPVLTRQYFWRMCAKNNMPEVWEIISSWSDEDLMKWVHR